jgi:hypothetical protein
VALMAKHMYYGRDFPLFFYGQNYGFSLIECLVIIPFYAVMGVSTLAVKLAMLSMWTTGCAFMYKTFASINKAAPSIPFLVILLFILCPAWAVWSMKARGGYLTSFVCTSILLYLLFDPKVKRDRLRFFVMGILIAVIYESQLLWLPGLAPLILYRLYNERSMVKTITFLLPAILLFAVFHLYIKGLPVQFNAQPFVSNFHEFTISVGAFFYHLYASLHGNYYLWFILRPGMASIILAVLFTCVIFLLQLAALCNIIRKKKGTTLFNVSALAVLLTLILLLFCRNESLRYFLPVTGCTVLSLALFLHTIPVKMKLAYRVSGLVIVTGIFSAISFKDYKVSWLSEKNVHDVVDYLTARDVHYVYSGSFLLCYYIDFYSGEQVLSRDWSFPGRYTPYAKKVDSALDNGAKTALIGFEGDTGDYCGINIPAHLIQHYENFYIIQDVSKGELAKGFLFR